MPCGTPETTSFTVPFAVPFRELEVLVPELSKIIWNMKVIIYIHFNNNSENTNEYIEIHSENNIAMLF